MPKAQPFKVEHDSTVYVGLDVHKESNTAAYALGAGEVEVLGETGTTKTDIDRLCKRLQSKARHILHRLRGRPVRLRTLPTARSEGIRLHGVRAFTDSMLMPLRCLATATFPTTSTFTRVAEWLRDGPNTQLYVA
jgi:hypothetical protein